MKTKLVHLLLAFLLCVTCAPARGQTNALRVGVTANFPPMISREGGGVVGVEADFAKALGDELGRPIKFVEVGWEDQIPTLIEGRTDIIMSGMSITLPRQLRVDFSNPYMLVGQTVLVRRADVKDYALGFPTVPPGVIGVLKATTGDFLVQQEFSRNKHTSYTSPEDAARALVKKKINLLICDSPTAWWLAGMNESEGLVVLPYYLSKEQVAWAVRKSDAELLKSVNAALEKMQKDGRAAAIIKHWIPLYR